MKLQPCAHCSTISGNPFGHSAFEGESFCSIPCIVNKLTHSVNNLPNKVTRKREVDMYDLRDKILNPLTIIKFKNNGEDKQVDQAIDRIVDYLKELE